MKHALKVYWPFLLLVPFVAAGIVGWFVLPAQLVIRTGNGSGLPRLIGLLVPLALAALGSSQVCFDGKCRMAGILILVIAAMAEVLLFAWNL